MVAGMSVHGARAQMSGRSPAEQEAALVDPDALDRLAAECGADIVDLVIDGFADEAAGGLAALETAIGAGDAAAAERALHGLRGGAMTLGLDRLVAAIRREEAVARAGAVPGKAALAALDALVTRSREALRVAWATGDGPA